jgi:hypothetical protein
MLELEAVVRGVGIERIERVEAVPAVEVHGWRSGAPGAGRGGSRGARAERRVTKTYLGHHGRAIAPVRHSRLPCRGPQPEWQSRRRP